MTFLAPAAGIVGAAIGIPVLLLMYFLRLRRRPLRVSSTLLWEQAAQDLQVNVPFRLLRWSWLLLLHLVALACFLLALARPAIGDGGLSGSRIVLVIDCSASMSATDIPPTSPGGPPTSRLDAAKLRAHELIDSVGRGGGGSQRPRCMVMSMAGATHAKTSFTSDLAILREAVDSIAPTDQPDNWAAALQLIDAMTTAPAGEGEGTPAPPSVYLITDRVVTPPTLPERRGLHAAVLDITSSDLSEAASHDNVGIVAMSATHDVEDPDLIRVFARLVNANTAPVEVALRCEIDGQLFAGGLTTVRLPAATQTAESLQPGEAAASLSIRPPASAASRIIITSISRADVLAADDAAGVVLSPAQRPRLLVVVPDPIAPGEPAEADIFLQQALEATVPASIRVIPASAAKAGDWSNTDIVVFDRVAVDALPPVPCLSFGIGLPLTNTTRLVAQASDPEMDSAVALAWKRDHPALRYVGLDTLLVAPAAQFQLPQVPDPQYVIDSLVEGAAGPLVVEVTRRTAGDRTLRTIAAAFDLSRSNWGPDISFPLFIGNCVEYLFAGDRAGLSAAPLKTTDSLSLSLPIDARSVSVSGPVESTLEVSGDPLEERTVRIGPFPRSGVYAFRTGDGRRTTPSAAVVNLFSDRESSLIPTLDARDSLPAGTTGQAAGADGGPREIWQWFILAALVPLSIEWFVYAWRMRS